MNLLWRWKYNGGNEKEKVAAVGTKLPLLGLEQKRN